MSRIAALACLAVMAAGTLALGAAAPARVVPIEEHLCKVAGQSSAPADLLLYLRRFSDPTGVDRHVGRLAEQLTSADEDAGVFGDDPVEAEPMGTGN